MTDYERTTTRETTTTPPVATEPYVAPAAAAPAPVATSVRTTDTAYVASGPGPPYRTSPWHSPASHP